MATSALQTEQAVPEALQKSRESFHKGLKSEIATHTRKRWFDAMLYQLLVIGSAVAGFLALALGLLAVQNPEYAFWAGVVGALTSVATVLSQQLQCVKAVNWHGRMAVELEIIRDKFEYNHLSMPDEKTLAALNADKALLKRTMTEAWEKVAASGPTVLGRVKKPAKETI